MVLFISLMMTVLNLIGYTKTNTDTNADTDINDNTSVHLEHSAPISCISYDGYDANSPMLITGNINTTIYANITTKTNANTDNYAYNR